MAMQSGKTMVSEVIKTIIVTYNSANDIAKCLNTLLLSSTKYAFGITVVDNGSTDETLDILRTLYPSIDVIKSANLGYAHGNNLGVQKALDDGYEYKAVLILNPDTALCNGAIDLLADAVFSCQDVGGVSPHIRGENDRIKSLFGSPMNGKPLMGRDVVITDRLHGCCMLLRPEVFKKAGFIDEQYFLYWEELDFGFRLMDAGFKLLLCYDVLMEHGHNSPERQHRVYYMWRNQFIFAKKNIPAWRRPTFLSRRMVTLFKELANFVRLKRFDLLAAALSGIAAGLLGETGKSPNRYARPPQADETNNCLTIEHR